jgi:predicted metal-binding protein
LREEEEETRRHNTGGREKKKEGETKQESFVVVVLLLVCGGVRGRAVANRARTQEERDAATAVVVVASISSDTAAATTTRHHKALASFPHCAQTNKQNKTSNHSLLKTLKDDTTDELHGRYLANGDEGSNPVQNTVDIATLSRLLSDTLSLGRSSQFLRGSSANFQRDRGLHPSDSDLEEIRSDDGNPKRAEIRGRMSGGGAEAGRRFTIAFSAPSTHADPPR